MNTRPSALVFALYLLGGGFVLAVGRLVFLAYGGNVPAVPLAVSDRPANTVDASTANNAVSHHVLARANQRLEELQTEVDRNRQLLESRTKQLHDKTNQCVALQSELDESLALLFSLVGDEARSEAANADTTRQQVQQVQGELDELRIALERSSTQRRQQTEEVDGLRAELVEAELELADLQFEAAEAITLLAQEQAAVGMAARSVVTASSSDEAVARVAALLQDPEPVVRAWAATTLGQFGLEAAVAIPALSQLLSDADERVRLAASDALAAIEP